MSTPQERIQTPQPQTGSGIAGAIALANDISKTTKDGASAAVVLQSMTEDERRPIVNFLNRVKAQAETTAQVKAAISEQKRAARGNGPKRRGKKAAEAPKAPVPSAPAKR